MAPTEATNRVAVQCLADGSGAPPEDETFLAFDSAGLPEDPAHCWVVLPTQELARARELLAGGVAGVMLGDAALRDAMTVATLAQEFGSQRVGVHAPLARLEISWAMDTESNADFRVMRPSFCEPAWELVLADGSRSGALAGW